MDEDETKGGVLGALGAPLATLVGVLRRKRGRELTKTWQRDEGTKIDENVARGMGRNMQTL